MRKKFAVVAACLLLAGCWESKGTLYGDTKPAEPFRAGMIVAYAADKPAERSHSVLTKAVNGVYRLTNADKGSPDLGDAMVLRFFAVPGLPRDVFLVEALSDDKCRPGRTCRPITPQSDRDYALVRVTKTGAEVTSPDCGKTSAAAKLPGVTTGDYGTCRFSNRAGLEAAARAQAQRPWAGTAIYRYE